MSLLEKQIEDLRAKLLDEQKLLSQLESDLAAKRLKGKMNLKSRRSRGVVSRLLRKETALDLPGGEAVALAGSIGSRELSMVQSRTPRASHEEEASTYHPTSFQPRRDALKRAPTPATALLPSSSLVLKPSQLPSNPNSHSPTSSPRALKGPVATLKGPVATLKGGDTGRVNLYSNPYSRRGALQRSQQQQRSLSRMTGFYKPGKETAAAVTTASSLPGIPRQPQMPQAFPIPILPIARTDTVIHHELSRFSPMQLKVPSVPPPVLVKTHPQLPKDSRVRSLSKVPASPPPLPETMPESQQQQLASIFADPVSLNIFSNICAAAGLSNSFDLMRRVSEFNATNPDAAQRAHFCQELVADFVSEAAPHLLTLSPPTMRSIRQMFSVENPPPTAFHVLVKAVCGSLGDAINNLNAKLTSRTSPRGPPPPPAPRRSPTLPIVPPAIPPRKLTSTASRPDFFETSKSSSSEHSNPEPPDHESTPHPDLSPHIEDSPNPEHSIPEDSHPELFSPQQADPDPYSLPSHFKAAAPPPATPEAFDDPYALPPSVSARFSAAGDPMGTVRQTGATRRAIPGDLYGAPVASTSMESLHGAPAAAPKGMDLYATPSPTPTPDDLYSSTELDVSSAGGESGDSAGDADDWEIDVSKCQAAVESRRTEFLYSSDSDGEDLPTAEHKASQERFFWNEKFQGLLKTVRFSSTFEDLGQKNQAHLDLVHLSANFSYAAKTYGRIIISEVHVKPKRKTIKPASLGGQAGGDKYIVQGILFKFAIDSSGLFKGDNHSASKVAGHELKGLVSYFSLNLQDINMPLMALVDYRGFRLIAMSMLPIGKESLIYGSNDAGRTVKCANANFSATMTQAGETLNIRPHWCGWSEETRQFLAAAADVEGHLGEDGQFYLLDFSRTLPPVMPDPRHYNGHLCQLFRPEFVKKYPKPLVSDAFSGFIMTDPNAREYNEHIVEATSRLKETTLSLLVSQYLIPKAAAAISDLKLLRQFALSIPQALHRFGVNLRYLGLIYHLLESHFSIERSGSSELLSQLILVEAIARGCKNILNMKLREKMRELKVPSQVPYLELTVECTNMIFSTESEGFWQTHIKAHLEKYFNFVLEQDEDDGSLQRTTFFSYKVQGALQGTLKQESGAMQTFSGRYWLLKRFSFLAGIRWTETALKRFKGIDKWHHKQPVNFLDLEAMEETVKHMRIVSDAAGHYFLGCGQAMEDQSLAAVLYSQARAQFDASLSWTPFSKDILLAKAVASLNHLNSIALVERRKPTEYFYPPQLAPLVQTVQSCFHEVLEVAGSDPVLFVCYAEFLARCEGKTNVAEHMFLRSLEVDPNYIYANLAYGLHLCRLGQAAEAELFLKRGTELDGKGQMPVSPLTGKVPGSRIRVYFENVNFSFRTLFMTVCMTPQDIADRLVHGLIRNLGSKDDISPDVMLAMQRKFLQFVLFEKPGPDKPLRQIAATEKPWLIVERPDSESQLHFKPPLGTVEAALEANVSVSSINLRPESANQLMMVLDSFTPGLSCPPIDQRLNAQPDLIGLIDQSLVSNTRFSKLCKSIPQDMHLISVCMVWRLVTGIWGFLRLDCGCSEMSASDKVSFSWRYDNGVVSSVTAVAYAHLSIDAFSTDFIKIAALPLDAQEEQLHAHSKRFLRIFGHIIFRHLDKLSVLREYFNISCDFSFHLLTRTLLSKSKRDDLTTLDPIAAYLKTLR